MPERTESRFYLVKEYGVIFNNVFNKKLRTYGNTDTVKIPFVYFPLLEDSR